MIDTIVQNFDLTTFLVALGFFALVSNFFNLIKAIIVKKKADSQVAQVEKKYEELKKSLKDKEIAIDDLLGGKKEAK